MLRQETSREGAPSAMRSKRPYRSIGISAILFAVGLGMAPCASLAGTLDDVRARGRLICGVSDGLQGFSSKDDAGAWHVFDVDFCRAVAAAVLGDPAKVEFKPYSAAAR